jgi:eukaryotic-like serine/threonine-protein kinase
VEVLVGAVVGVLVGGFGMLLEQRPRIRERLSCPTQAEQGGAGTTAEQQFGQGSMFYFSMTEQVYVLLGRDSGQWLRFEREDLLPLPTPTPADAPVCDQPMHGGFQLAWENFDEVSMGLGCPTGPEDGLFEGAYQPFDRGTMLYSQKGLGRGKTLYVLYEDGTFERYDDPNP